MASELVGRALLREFEILTRALGGGEAVGDLLLTLRPWRFGDRRPDVAHDDPDEDEKGDRLTDQRGVDVHVSLSSAARLRAARKAGRIPAAGVVGARHCANSDVQRDTHGDHRHGVDEAEDDEELRAQGRQLLGLARDALDELAAEHAHADGCAEGAHAPTATAM